MKKRVKTSIGWREWVALPDLGIKRLKAKIDTGAASSSLHAWNIEEFVKKGETWIRFDIHPLQKDNKTSVTCKARVVDMRRIKSSNGQSSTRYVIETTLKLGEVEKTIELNLARRDQMGFRMLLGRQGLRPDFIVDPAKSFLTGKL